MGESRARWIAIGQSWQHRSSGVKQGFGFSGGGERGEQRESAGEFVALVIVGFRRRRVEMDGYG